MKSKKVLLIILFATQFLFNTKRELGGDGLSRSTLPGITLRSSFETTSYNTALSVFDLSVHSLMLGNSFTADGTVYKGIRFMLLSENEFAQAIKLPNEESMQQLQ